MKEKIGKLLELLNEYELGEDYGDMGEYYYIDTLGNIVDDGGYILKPCEIISKKFGFIKWLVENDKISNDGIKPRTDLVKEITIVDYKTGDAIGWKNKYTEVEQLIMYLSIQDEPIRFLCEILK